MAVTIVTEDSTGWSARGTDSSTQCSRSPFGGADLLPGSPVSTPGGYPALFIGAAVIGIIGAVLVTRIKGVN